MKAYQRVLKEKGTTQGMSRKATCLDHAVAEHFFGLLKTELFYLETFNSIDQLEQAIVEYIGYYHNHRIKLKLNGLSPVHSTGFRPFIFHAKAPIRKVSNRTKGLDAFRFAVVCIMRRWFGFSENLIGAVLIVFVP